MQKWWLLLSVLWCMGGGAQSLEQAVFAGGCFWCMEKPFDALDGVVSTTSGYAGGERVSPTYEQVSSGLTGHAEVVQVSFDPARISFTDLLAVYWRNIDPYDGGGQFCDRGNQYRPAIFPQSDQQRQLAEASLAAMARKLGRALAVTIEPGATFYPAEKYHQNYYQRNPIRYKYYRYACGRDQRLSEVWGSDGG